jgi:hypothetical protein
LGIDISTGIAETAIPPTAGIMATEMVIRTAKIVRVTTMRMNYQAIRTSSQQSRMDGILYDPDHICRRDDRLRCAGQSGVQP